GPTYGRTFTEPLNKMKALLKKQAPTRNAPAYADQRAALQAAMSMAKLEMQGYTDNRVLEGIQTDFQGHVRRFAYGAASGVGGIIAVVLSILTPGALAVHPLAAIGFAVGLPIMVVGGGVAYVAWRRAVNGAHDKLNKSIADLENTYKTSPVHFTHPQ